MGGGESGRVLLPGCLQGLGALPGGVAGQAVVDISGRMKANPAMKPEGQGRIRGAADGRLVH